jgi:hypothetical protein
VNIEPPKDYVELMNRARPAPRVPRAESFDVDRPMVGLVVAMTVIAVILGAGAIGYWIGHWRMSGIC